MNILQVISYLYPAYSFGGPGVLVFDLSRKLAKNGHKVTIYSTDAFDREKRRNRTDNEIFDKLDIKTYFLKNLSNFLACRFKVFTPFFSFWRIKKEIKKFDAVHIHEFFTFLNIFVSFYAWRNYIPYVISAHGTLDAFHFSHRKTFKTIFMKLFGDRIIKNASRFIAATKEEVKEYQSLGINKISYIPNGLNLDGFRRLPPRGLFRSKLGISSNAKIILYLGRINKLKGLDILVKSFVRLVKDIDSKFIIAGSDDGYLSTLKNLVSDLNLDEKVIFPGLMEGDEKLSLYTDADVFVYPSPAEGFSLAVLEAASCGLPLVITHGCKFPEVEKYQAGVIVELNVDVLYQAMKSLINDESFMRQTGLNAKKMVNNNYNISLMAENLEKVYKDIIENK